MRRYHCTFKISAAGSPSSVSFEAQHTGRAIMKLMSLANVKNSMEFSEAQILECVRTADGKVGYIVVFEKLATEQKGKVSSRGMASNVTELKPPAPACAAAPPEAPTSDVYKRPYTVEVM